MAPLPPARARVHGVVGEAVRASAVLRHTARRTSVAAIATAKVVLWLGVVIASLVAIGSLGRSRHPRYPDLEALRQSTAQLERDRRALAEFIRTQQLIDQLTNDLRRRELAADLARPPRPLPMPAHHDRR